jgi:hypothetical protein
MGEEQLETLIDTWDDERAAPSSPSHSAAQCVASVVQWGSPVKQNCFDLFG